MSDTALVTRTADALQQIGEARARLDALVARLSSDSQVHGQMVMLQRTLEELHLVITREYGQWRRGEVSGAALVWRLDQWDVLPS